MNQKEPLRLLLETGVEHITNARALVLSSTGSLDIPSHRAAAWQWSD